MKRKTILFSLLFALMLIAPLSLAASAEETAVDEQPHTDLAAGAEDSEATVFAPEVAVPSESERETDGDNLFAVLYEKIGDSFGDILAAVAAIASLLLVFTYKKGFLPLLSGAFDRLTGTVKNAGEDAKAQTDAAKKLADDLLSRLNSAEKTLEKFSALLCEYAEKLPAVEAQKGETAVFQTVLLGQIGLLEEVFMASSLPQYRKDEIGERVAAMKAAVHPEVSPDGETKD